MKLLHTSDWHLGCTLSGRKRYEEFNAFFSWLDEVVREEKVDALLVAGDIFDNSFPGTRAQELYYRFLCQMANSCCRHVVIIAGNHDSPSFLNAPKELLRHLHVHIIGSAGDSPEDEILLLKDDKGATELIVCAVPYLRDRDIRTAEAGESLEDKGQKLLAGIRSHYQAVSNLAIEKRKELNDNIPIVGMGHLFTAGGQVMEGEGMRELYIGSLAHVPSTIFHDQIDYFALGHLHIPQKVSGSETRRYSGSPLPMGFGEAKQEKSVCLVEFQKQIPHVRPIAIPCFQRLERVQGNWEQISIRLHELATAKSNAWIEIIYNGEEVISHFKEKAEEIIAGTDLEILRTKNKKIMEQALSGLQNEETLDDLDVNDVFLRCLDAHNVPEEQRPTLFAAYGEIITSLQNDE